MANRGAPFYWYLLLIKCCVFAGPCGSITGTSFWSQTLMWSRDGSCSMFMLYSFYPTLKFWFIFPLGLLNRSVLCDSIWTVLSVCNSIDQVGFFLYVWSFVFTWSLIISSRIYSNFLTIKWWFKLLMLTFKMSFIFKQFLIESLKK